MPGRGLWRQAAPPAASSCCLLFGVRLKVLRTCVFPGPAGGFTVSRSAGGVGEGFLRFLPQRQWVFVGDRGLRASGRGRFSCSVIRSAVTSFWLFLQEQAAFPLYPRSSHSAGGFQACGLVASDLPWKCAGLWPWLDSLGSPVVQVGLAYLHH